MVTKAKSAKNMRVGVYLNGTGSAPTFFKEVKAIPALGESPERIDVTHLESDAHEYIKDISDVSGDLSVTMNADPYVSSGANDASNLNIIAAMDKNASYTFIVLYPALNQQATIYGDWSWEMGSGAVSQAMEITLTIIPRGAPIFNDFGVSTYTVSYNPVSTSGTGTGTMTAKTAEMGESVKAGACTFTAPIGMKFGSWNTQADGFGTTYGANDSILIYGNVTLYAIWVTDNGE